MNRTQLHLKQEYAPTRRLYSNGEGDLQIEITVVNHDTTNPNDLMRLWVKNGYMQEALPATLCANTYYYENNTCSGGLFNPTIDRATRKINFDWKLEATPENEQKLLQEIAQRYDRYTA